MNIQTAPPQYWTIQGQKKVADLDAVVSQIHSGELSVPTYEAVDLVHWREPNQSEQAQARGLRTQAAELHTQAQASTKQAGTAFKLSLGSLGVAGLSALARLPVVAGASLALGLGSSVYAAVLKGRSAAQEVGSGRAQEQAGQLEQPKQLESGELRVLPGSTMLYRNQDGLKVLAGDPDQGVQRALQAYDSGVQLDGNYSHRSRALFTIAASIAGPNTPTAEAMGKEMDGNYSHDSRATFSIAAALAGTEESARQAYSLGSEMDGNYSHKSRATYTEAAAIAGTPEAAKQAEALGREMDGNYSHESRAVFTAAAATAGSADKAHQAFELGQKFDGNYSHESRAAFTLAAAIASSPEKAEEAVRLGGEFDGNYSHDSRAMFTIAAAIAGDEQKARTAFALGQEFDGNYSHHSRGRFTIAAAAALNPDKAHFAAVFPDKDDE